MIEFTLAFVAILVVAGTIGGLRYWLDGRRSRKAWALVKREADRRASELLKERPAQVDRRNTELTDAVPAGTDHRELKPNGQQQAYVVLSAEERAKGFVRPVRRKYVHKVCGTMTRMSQEIAETYARDPHFYSGTFCCGCGRHLPLDEFVWDGTNETVGS